MGTKLVMKRYKFRMYQDTPCLASFLPSVKGLCVAALQGLYETGARSLPLMLSTLTVRLAGPQGMLPDGPASAC
jgi:hypothetical protein